jgi:hypothetical protein
MMPTHNVLYADNTPLCYQCGGCGEGNYDGSTCQDCGGTGHVTDNTVRNETRQALAEYCYEEMHYVH